MIRTNKILMVYIEPTPYLTGLIEEITRQCKDEVDILFLTENKSQKWNIDKDNAWFFMPDTLMAKIFCIGSLFLQKRYSMIHLAGWSDPVCLSIILLSKIFRIPVVIESDTSLHKVAFHKKILKGLVYPVLFKLVNLFLPGGIRQAKYLEYYGVKSQYIVPVNMTVDVKKIQNTIVALTNSDFLRIRNFYQFNNFNCIFLFVGRLEKYKGIIDLLYAFVELNNPQTALIIVGDGPMKPIVENYELENKNIKYLGRLNEKQLIEIYSTVNVLVLPSHFEPWGLVVNEAMAAGLPVIVSNKVGCIDDLVQHNKSGMIFESENIIDLKNSLQHMVDLPSEGKQMGKYAASIIADWTLENEAKNICHAWNLTY